jgi:uncharacterized protein involved in copper resistance
MMKWFRRQRLVAALLILANPALVGSWVAAYHPCPVQDGAAHGRTVALSHVAAPAVDHAGHDGMVMEEAPAPSHDHSQNDGHCSCIGQCLATGIALPTDTGRESQVAVVVTRHTVSIPQSALALPVSAPLDLLPPSTAPPIV